MIEVPIFRDPDDPDGEGIGPEEYAAQWGCDPKYDRGYRRPGDGYLFYNFGSERQEKTPEFLSAFVGAVERTIQQAGAESASEHTLADLWDLLNYVKALLVEAAR